MISFIEGKIEFRGQKFIVLNVNNVGYKVRVGQETLQKVPENGESVKLWTHQYVREDALELYGFLNYPELEFFETLINVPGIGPKSGLGILGVAPLDTLKKAIAAGDISYLTRVSGVGRKTAEKIVLELKEKMAGKGISVEAPELKEEADALEALVQLGYSQRDARNVLQNIPGDVVSLEKRVGLALKKLGERR